MPQIIEAGSIELDKPESRIVDAGSIELDKPSMSNWMPTTGIKPGLEYPFQGMTFDVLKKGFATGSLGMISGVLGFIKSATVMNYKYNPQIAPLTDIAESIMKKSGKSLYAMNDPLSDAIKYYSKWSDEIQPAYEQGTPEYYAYNAVSSMTQNIPLLGLGIATGTSAIPLLGNAAIAAGNKYNELRDRGFSHLKASLIGGMYGAAEYIGDKIPLGHYMKGFQLKHAIIGSLLEIPGELVTEMIDMGLDAGILHEKDALNWQRLYDTAIITGITSPFLAGASHGAARLANRNVTPMKDLVQVVTGAPVTDIYIPDEKPDEQKPKTHYDAAREVMSDEEINKYLTDEIAILENKETISYGEEQRQEETEKAESLTETIVGNELVNVEMPEEGTVKENLTVGDYHIETENGEQKYSIQSPQQSLTLAIEQIQKEFPTQTITETPTGFTVTMQNGMALDVNLSGEISVNEADAIKAGYTREQIEEGKAIGSFQQIGMKGIITLTDAGVKELPHEIFHAARSMVLTKQENDVLDKAFNGDEEAMANGYKKFRDTNKASMPSKTLFQKIIDFFRKIRSILTRNSGLTPEEIFKRIESGEVWNKGSEKRQFTKTKEGNTDFGYLSKPISTIIKRQAAPIRMQKGDIKFGKVHIDMRHGDQIKNAGYESIESLVEEVAAGYTSIYQGRGATLQIAKKNGNNIIAYIELKPSEEGDYYSVQSAFIVRKNFFNNKTPLWEGAQSLHSSLDGETPGAVSGQSDDKVSLAEGTQSVKNTNYKIETPEETAKRRLALWNDWAAARKERKIDLAEQDITNLEELAKSTGKDTFLEMLKEERGKPSAIWKETGLARSAVDFWNQVNRTKNVTNKNMKHRPVNLEGFINEETGEMYKAGEKTSDILELEAMADKFIELKGEYQRRLAGAKEGQEVYDQLKKKLENVKKGLGSIKTRVREITGQVRTDERLIPEMQALNEAMKQAEKASIKAYREGDKNGALRELSRVKAMESMKAVRVKAQKEAQKFKKFLKFMGTDKALKNIDPEYRQAVKFAISNNGDGVELFMLKELNNGDITFIADDQIEMMKNTNPDSMTLDELRNTASVVKQLVYQGRRKRQIMVGNQRYERKALINDLVKEAREENHTEEKTVEEVIKQQYLLGIPKDRQSMMKRGKEILDSMLSNLRKAKYILNNLVAYKENSLLLDATYNQMVDSEKVELNLSYKTSEMLKNAFAHIRVGLQSGEINKPYEVPNTTLPGTNDRLVTTKFNAITIALNSGNEGNRRALREGSSGILTDERIDAVVASLTIEERNFVQGIWSILEYQRPHLQEAYKKMSGEDMPLVEGQYYPLMFDENLASVIAEKQQEQDLFRLYGNIATVARGFTMKRKGTGQPPSLDFMKIIDHIANVNHFIAYGNSVRDVNRIINDKLFRDVAVEHIGEAQYKQLRPWLKSIANPHYEAMTGWDKAMQRLRNNSAVAVLGWSLSTSILQPTAVTQAIHRLGATDTVKGFIEFYRDPFVLKEFIESVSPFMKMRTSNFDSTIAEIMRGDKDAVWKDSNRLKESFFSFISMADKITTLPVWYTAFSQKLEQTGSQKEAIKYADSIVTDTQSSGMPKDLAEVQRGNATRKAFVMFYSYFSTTYNEAVRTVDLVKHGKAGFLDLFKSFWWLFAVPALFQGLLKSVVKKKKKEETPMEIAKELVGYGAATIPVVGSIINAALDNYEFRPSPVMNLPVEAIKTLYALKGDRAYYGRRVPEYLRHGWMAAGYAFGLPSRQTLLLADQVWDVMHRNEIRTENIAGLIYSNGGKKR